MDGVTVIKCSVASSLILELRQKHSLVVNHSRPALLLLNIHFFLSSACNWSIPNMAASWSSASFSPPFPFFSFSFPNCDFSNRNLTCQGAASKSQTPPPKTAAPEGTPGRQTSLLRLRLGCTRSPRTACTSPRRWLSCSSRERTERTSKSRLLRPARFLLEVFDDDVVGGPRAPSKLRSREALLLHLSKPK